MCGVSHFHRSCLTNGDRGWGDARQAGGSSPDAGVGWFGEVLSDWCQLRCDVDVSPDKLDLGVHGKIVF